MDECGDRSDADKSAPIEKLLMEKVQVRAIANYFRTFHGADSFVKAVQHARALNEAGELETAAVWTQIAEEISEIETQDALERCLTR
jgi:hypothetical protein